MQAQASNMWVDALYLPGCRTLLINLKKVNWTSSWSLDVSSKSSSVEILEEPQGSLEDPFQAGGNSLHIPTDDVCLFFKNNNNNQHWNMTLQSRLTGVSVLVRYC